MSSEDKKPKVHQSTHINLKVKGQDGIAVFFKIKKTIKLGKLMKEFCNQKCQDLKSLAFLYDGKHINADHTPEELEMEDGDEIDALPHQFGGVLFSKIVV